MTMTMVLSAISSYSGLSEGVIVSMLTVLLTLLLGYIFYPALSLSFADSIVIHEKTVSNVQSSGAFVIL